MSDTTESSGLVTPSTRAVFLMAWPLGLKAVMLHGIVVIDALLVSALGEQALAAMGLASSLVGLLLGILFAFSNATQIRIAQAVGLGRPEALKSGFYAGLLTNLCTSGAGLVLVWLAGGHIIEHFAHNPWIAEQARLYMNVFLIVILIEAVGQCLGSFFNGCGKTKLAFQSHLIAVPINVAVSYALIHGLYGLPELGVVGAAAGSVVASLTRAAFLGAAFFRQTGGFRDVQGWQHSSFAHSFRRHMVFSLPIAGAFVSMVVATQVCMLLYARMSVNDFAAMTLIDPWIKVAGTFGMAWAQAVGIAMAQLLGKHTASDALDEFLGRMWRVAFIAAAIVAAAYAILCLSTDLLYTNLQPETRAAIWAFLPILVLLPFPKGSNAICGQTLRAAGDTLYVMNIFIFASWVVKVPLTALFILVWDLPVFWVFALFVAEELAKFPPFHLRLFKGLWKQGVSED